MPFIQCISITAAVTTVIHFTTDCLSSCFRDDNPETIGNTEYTNFSLPCFDPPSPKKEVSKEYILLTEQ